MRTAGFDTRAGSFDRRVRFETLTQARDAAYGTSSPTWSPVVGLEEVYVSIFDIMPSSSVMIAQGMEQSYQPSRVRMPYTDVPITTSMRIIDLDRGDRILTVITEAAEHGRKVALEFMVNRFTARGDA